MSPNTRRPRGVTVIDVAKYAGVSPMTVSRVINADPGVRDSTRVRVTDAIRTLNYTPNLVARSLVTSREVRIGVIYSNPSAAFMSDLLAGVFEEASARAAQLILLKGDNGKPPTQAAIEGLIASGVGGIILAPPLGESDVVRTILAAANLPIAVVGAVAPDAICVSIDNRRAAYDMTRHLIGLGHRKLGFILGNPDQSASRERLAGFEMAVEEDGALETQVVRGDFSYASGLVAGEELLDQPTPPTAVFASNDDMAAAVVSVAHRRHLDVPGDLTVTGFDDSTAAVTLWPPLTTIHQPVRALAAEALQRLIQAMRSGVRTPQSHILDHRLIERESTAGPRRPAPGV
ncbi:LacI family DNA-binding transcriptional regulator [Sphingomonas sp. LB3N6]|uniref:LacI family DNA-binding transcriptional regulator n=1 Tax=Sphingomonas fucosidasi TaxID=3096164 RepID=UPI002FC8206F